MYRVCYNPTLWEKLSAAQPCSLLEATLQKVMNSNTVYQPLKPCSHCRGRVGVVSLFVSSSAIREMQEFGWPAATAEGFTKLLLESGASFSVMQNTIM